MEFRAGNGISDCIQKQLNLSLKKNKSVEDQINGAVKRTLLSDCHIEFVPSKKQSSFKLHELKSKYTVLKPSASVIQADQVKNEVQLGMLVILTHNFFSNYLLHIFKLYIKF